MQNCIFFHPGTLWEVMCSEVTASSTQLLCWDPSFPFIFHGCLFFLLWAHPAWGLNSFSPCLLKPPTEGIYVCRSLWRTLERGGRKCNGRKPYSLFLDSPVFKSCGNPRPGVSHRPASSPNFHILLGSFLPSLPSFLFLRSSNSSEPLLRSTTVLAPQAG